MPDAALIEHLTATAGLSSREAARVIDDVVAYFSESTEEFVRRRHGELQATGARNAQIFAQLRTELDSRVVAAPSLSERQLRRIVYG